MSKISLRAAALIEYLQTSGNELREPRSKSLGNGLFELRGKQVRIFYVFRPGNRIVLLDGMLKKRTDIPDRMMRRYGDCREKFNE
jgi:phage-related protein